MIAGRIPARDSEGEAGRDSDLKPATRCSLTTRASPRARSRCYVAAGGSPPMSAAMAAAGMAPIRAHAELALPLCRMDAGPLPALGAQHRPQHRSADHRHPHASLEHPERLALLSISHEVARLLDEREFAGVRDRHISPIQRNSTARRAGVGNPSLRRIGCRHRPAADLSLLVVIDCGTVSIFVISSTYFALWVP